MSSLDHVFFPFIREVIEAINMIVWVKSIFAICILFFSKKDVASSTMHDLN